MVLGVLGTKIILANQNCEIILIKCQIAKFSNIAIKLLLPIKWLLFQLCSSESCRSKPFHLLYRFYMFMAVFLHCFPYSYCSSNYYISNNDCSFTLLKAKAKSWESDNFRKAIKKRSKIFIPKIMQIRIGAIILQEV